MAKAEKSTKKKSKAEKSTKKKSKAEKAAPVDPVDVLSEEMADDIAPLEDEVIATDSGLVDLPVEEPRAKANGRVRNGVLECVDCDGYRTLPAAGGDPACGRCGGLIEA
jgi:hypothetical protein